jgi:hypothetical protein
MAAEQLGGQSDQSPQRPNNHSEGGRDREGEYRPPQLRYRWQPLEQFPEETQASIRRTLELQTPGFGPSEVLYTLGEPAGRVILGLAFTQASLRASIRMQGRLDDPSFLGRGIIPTAQINLVEENGTHPARVLMRHNRITERDYGTAREILLDEVNDILGSLEINKIPPPQPNANPTA